MVLPLQEARRQRGEISPAPIGAAEAVARVEVQASASAGTTDVDHAGAGLHHPLRRPVRRLTELAATPAIVVGVGLNVGWPVDADAREALVATSLAACLAELPPRETILASVLAEFEATLTIVENDPRRLRELHLERSLTVGREVRIARADGTNLEGRAVDIDEDGRIVVRASGVDEALSAGDVTHLR